MRCEAINAPSTRLDLRLRRHEAIAAFRFCICLLPGFLPIPLWRCCCSSLVRLRSALRSPLRVLPGAAHGPFSKRIISIYYPTREPPSSAHIYIHIHTQAHTYPRHIPYSLCPYRDIHYRVLSPLPRMRLRIFFHDYARGLVI